jgi:hypothetical protein
MLLKFREIRGENTSFSILFQKHHVGVEKSVVNASRGNIIFHHRGTETQRKTVMCLSGRLKNIL